MIVAFGWCGYHGFKLLRGRALSFGALLGLLALILIQVPIIGGLPGNGYEFSGGLQYAVLFGAVEHHLEFHPAADVHINTAFSEPYFGINIVALVAGIVIGLNLLVRWHKDKDGVAQSSTTA